MRAIVVTTEKRGVFFGYCEDESTAPEKLVLNNCRMCVYWSAAERGVLGLAAVGPLDGCRISNAVDSVTLWQITGIFAASDKAVKRWEDAPWS